MNRTENFIKGSNNVIELTLTEDNAAIDGVWNTLSIYIGNPALVTITRANGDPEAGVNFTNGLLTINPGKLGLSQSELDALVVDELYPVWIKIVSSIDSEGVDFGAPDSIDTLSFWVSERP